MRKNEYFKLHNNVAFNNIFFGVLYEIYVYIYMYM